MSVDRGEKTSQRGRTTPADAPASPATIDRDGGALALRLAIGKDGLGIELARPASLACVDVVELVVRLPHVKFPFDVTGGVARFRHRRGELDRVALAVDGRRLVRWAAPRLNGLVAPGAARLRVVPRPFGASVVVTNDVDPATVPAGTRVPVLAFDVALVPRGDELALVVHAARGANLAEPATTAAVRAVAAVLGPLGPTVRREGSAFVLARAAADLAGRLLPDAGVRAPGVSGVALASADDAGDVLSLVFARGGQAVTLPPAATAAREAALLAREGDEARLQGDRDRARKNDLEALERAPRHPELARRIAEIDHAVGGRAEAALAILREASKDRHPVGALKAELLVEVGDRSAAVATLLGEAEREPAGTLAAALFARAAELAEDPNDALHWLDAAIARAPERADLRWARAARRIRAGRLDGARADIGELDALAEGPRARFHVATRAAHLYRDAGLGADATELYERALRYRPDDPDAVAGLGVALAQEGRKPRGAALLAQAIDLAFARRLPTSWMELELGRILADVGDLPAAIARLRAIRDDADEAPVARALEGRLRSTLGDASGASLAFARLRELARDASLVPWLQEASSFEEGRGDAAAAQRHVLAALALAPASAELLEASRRLGRLAVPVPAPVPVPDRVPSPVFLTAPDPEPAPPPAVTVPAPAPLDEAEAEHRVEALTRTLQGDPTNDAVVDELTGLLTRLGRGMELLALLSARLEDAPEERRRELLPRHREVLERLEAEARADGREGEADLFRMAREAAV